MWSLQNVEDTDWSAKYRWVICWDTLITQKINCGFRSTVIGWDKVSFLLTRFGNDFIFRHFERRESSLVKEPSGDQLLPGEWKLLFLPQFFSNFPHPLQIVRADRSKTRFKECLSFRSQQPAIFQDGSLKTIKNDSGTSNFQLDRYQLTKL